MKKTILAIIITLFITNYSVANIHTSECEKITGVLKTGEKIDCMLNLKKKKIDGDKIKKNIKKDLGIDKAEKKLKTLNQKKKKFDEENKTLWRMLKKNNDK
jgi:hypothetical protein